MSTDLARLDLLVRRRSTLAYAGGMALYMLAIVALYPAFRASTGLDELTSSNPGLAALFGVTGSLTSPGGWVAANAYTNIFPLIILMVCIGYGAAAIAGQDDDGTLGLVATLPTSRRSIVLQKVAAMVVMSLAVSAAVAVGVFAGRAFDLALAPGHVITATLAVALLGIDFGVLALAIGAMTGARGAAIGAASAIAAVGYLISSLAPVVHWLGSVRFISPFYWAVGDDQISQGAGAASFAVLVGIAMLAGAWAVVAFERADMH